MQELTYWMIPVVFTLIDAIVVMLLWQREEINKLSERRQS